MDLQKRAKQAVSEVGAAIDVTLSPEQTRKVSEIIERAIADAVATASERSQTAARACCEADEDMAHKLAREIERANIVLIANLSALR